MKYYVIDAFADRLFSGNPAGICLPEREIPDTLMQKIAFENNLAETAFLMRDAEGYRLRWFTPAVEIDLCGHATLAAAFVIMEYIDRGRTQIRFETQSGMLEVVREGGLYTMDFPRRAAGPVAAPPLLEQALGCPIAETRLARDLLVRVGSEAEVAGLKPDISLLGEITEGTAFAVIVTAAGETCDFVSRFFAPNAGIAEDPVTGSAHSTLIPYWSERLHKPRMTARQLSPRGGMLICEDMGDRVAIGGTAVCYLEGEIRL